LTLGSRSIAAYRAIYEVDIEPDEGRQLFSHSLDPLQPVAFIKAGRSRRRRDGHERPVAKGIIRVVH